ncbi:MAG: TolC family protein [Deltaproteobacteria bacterium]|nr:TolC family protein [Deltaproteobacteria bacterium]
MTWKKILSVSIALWFFMSHIKTVHTAFAKELSLDEILEMAQGDTTGKRLIEASYHSQMAETMIYRSAALPQLNFLYSAQKSSLSLLDQGLPPGSPERMSGNEYSWRLNLEAPVFSFGRIGTLWQLVNLREELSSYDRERQTDDYFRHIIQSYMAALLARARAHVASLNLKHSQSTFDFIKTEFEGGSIGKTGMLRAQAEHLLAQANHERAETESQASMRQLKYNLKISPEKDLTLKLEDQEKSCFFRNNLPKHEVSITEGAELRLASIRQKITEKTIDYRRSSYFPTLALIANAGASVRTHDDGTGNTAEHADILRNNRMSYFAGLSLSWNLFDGMRTTSELHQALADASTASLQLENLREQKKIDRERAADSLSASDKVLNASREGMEAMKIVAEQSELDFKGGNSSLTELLEARRDYYRVINQYYEALAEKASATMTARLAYGLTVLGESQP